MSASRTASSYDRSRLNYIGVTFLIWFLLYLGLGYLIVGKLPGVEPLPFGVAWVFYVVGFFPILFFGAPGMLIGFLDQYLDGAFTIKDDGRLIRPPLLWRAHEPNNPWLLGINRLLLFWLPAALLTWACLKFLLADGGIQRGELALSLAVTGGLLASLVSIGSTGAPFIHELRCTPAQHAWRGSLGSYLFYRHGLLWGIGNGALNAILAIPFFPKDQASSTGLASPVMVGVDILLTSLILCFFMALSARPHARVDARLGVIAPPGMKGSPGTLARAGWFVFASLLLSGITTALVQITAPDGITLPLFIVLKATLATLIAGAAAMMTAYWTLAGMADVDRK